jgi:hypothetical protein
MSDTNIDSSINAKAVSDEHIEASVWVLFLYDVCEEIDLNALHHLADKPLSWRKPTFPYPTPEYLRFEHPPLSEAIDGARLSESVADARIGWYDYGVATLQIKHSFSGTWKELAGFVARSVAGSELERRATELIRERCDQVKAALRKPYAEILDEDYYIVHLAAPAVKNGAPVRAEELLFAHRQDIAMIVRADIVAPSNFELRDVGQSSMSYSPVDATVIGWNAAFVYDTPEGAAPVIELLEYANAQLLEFRRYDEVLTAVLTKVYGILETRKGIWRRWRLAREAEQLNTIRLEVRELTERMDNSIKFFGDVFSARLYRLAASKVGVPDYRKLVDEKLRTAHDQYQFMMDEFYQSRAFILELTIVLILIVDLAFLFRGVTSR